MKKASISHPVTAVPPVEWDLRLYIAGPNPKSAIALRNLKRFCEEHMAFRYRIEVIDLMQNPQLAQGDQILAVPTLVRKLPSPIRKIIGDLSNTERVFVGLDLRPRDSSSRATVPASQVPELHKGADHVNLNSEASQQNLTLKGKLAALEGEIATLRAELTAEEATIESISGKHRQHKGEVPLEKVAIGGRRPHGTPQSKSKKGTRA